MSTSGDDPRTGSGGKPDDGGPRRDPTAHPESIDHLWPSASSSEGAEASQPEQAGERHGSDRSGSEKPEAAPHSESGSEQAESDTPSDAPSGAGDDAESSAPRRAGSISYQDAESTAPREPTLAERRARQQAALRAKEEEAARWDAEEKAAKKRKRVLIGGAVTVGVVALVAIAYSASGGDEQQVQARCVGPDNVVVSDDNCVRPASDAGQYHSGGFGFIPIFIGGGNRQYHYNYGGGGGIGQVATGGTTVPPKNATVRTPSGKTVAGSSSVSRGGFGVSGESGRSGGS